MIQVVQNIRSGELTARSVPPPCAQPGHVLIANRTSLISAGTEKMAIELARKSLLGKARERPDQVRRVLEKLRNEGFFNTLAQVLERLDEPMTLGYSSAGTVLACGAGVQGFKPGDRVASNGPHAGVVSVPKHLCAHVPENVAFEQASFTVLGAIALQGVRLAKLGLADNAFVIGLGLVGQITVALLRAQGARVIGTDLDPKKCELALKLGAEIARPNLNAQDVLALTRSLGADAVLIAASTESDGPVALAGEAVRQKGRVVAIGAVGLDLPRRPYYFKEAELVVSCSYGPGRYDPEYEERGHDYPAGHVRWTEQRNMQAVLDLMAAGKLDLAPLVTHRFKIENAAAAYELIETNREPYLGIVLEYDATQETSRKRIELAAAKSDRLGVACIGAGNFARMVLLPAIKKAPALEPRLLVSAKGLSAVHSAEKLGFAAAATDLEEALKDPAIGAVFIATRHDEHADQVTRALRAGKHVFVEKPLALTVEQLDAIERALTERPKQLLTVGFNRRFSPAALEVKKFLADAQGPLTVSIRFNAGEIPAEHWTQDELVGGGRIVGEACHAIDLATFLLGSPPSRVFAESIGGSGAPTITDDQCFITLRHANGSIANVGYLAGGDKAFPKERVEVIGAGRVAVIDDFREVTTTRGGKTKRHRAWRQEKGHQAEVLAFADAITQGKPAPISWEELRRVTLASILAVRSLREGIPFDVP